MVFSSEGQAIKYHLRTPVITRRMLVWASALSVVTILSIVGYLLVREYRNTEDDAARSALNIVQLISRDIRNTISIYDSALNSLSAWCKARRWPRFRRRHNNPCFSTERPRRRPMPVFLCWIPTAR